MPMAVNGEFFFFFLENLKDQFFVFNDCWQNQLNYPLNKLIHYSEVPYTSILLNILLKIN